MFSWHEVHAFLDLIGTPQNLRPRYNVLPSQRIAVVRAEEDGRRLSMLRWGLIPGWSRDASIGARLINARSETAASKPAFRQAFAHRRCLVPADGYFEWRGPRGAKQPYFIRRKDGGLCTFAALWDRWTVPPGARTTGTLSELRPGDSIESVAILTTQANELLAPIHPRIPVLLDADAFEPWFGGKPVPLGPYPSAKMTAYPVSTLVNRPSNDDPRCIEPIAVPQA